jgi:hypothetical protein
MREGEVEMDLGEVLVSAGGLRRLAGEATGLGTSSFSDWLVRAAVISFLPDDLI